MSDHDEPILLKCCPFLGARDDKDMVNNYPSVSNACHAAGVLKRRFWVFTERRSYQDISPKKQEKTCLTDEWVGCPIYKKRKQTDAQRRAPAGKP